ncbi:polyprenyl synthetase family protein [Maribacter cobaltidurans]|uniref:Polyprenyl synthetase n=1 Tax=Maribacter cobaltidurans TaxID=1178778 RepID=A0A223VB46_9FLAO|nr:polyprenyl synthetase family protein [Maribacter cobaltidurans]ASV32594.1 polyprenyl synthetase [Maribacter cobaltidurans]GGD88091.1 isoprenyl synthetase [Maribacter cobaltidurans]
MHSIDFYRAEFMDYLDSKFVVQEPTNLYEPINYILKLGGKRLRPVLALLTAEIFDGSYKEALNAALAIEVFHNFSLVHDDIMDAAPVRRGKTTVHEKWDTNTGILSGDAMLICAYQLFENYEPKTFRALAELFSKTALQVCEGQQYDVDFETRDDVSLPEYLKMIEYKTAVLVAAAMKMGGIVAQTSKENQELIYGFGLNLGIAFQLQDDLLDVFGDPETFGKQVGGDIIENKKTYLFIKAIESGSTTVKKELLDLYSIQPKEPEDKIEAVKSIFQESGASKATQEAISLYTEKAFEILESLDISDDKKLILKDFGENLMRRTV